MIPLLVFFILTGVINFLVGFLVAMLLGLGPSSFDQIWSVLLGRSSGSVSQQQAADC